MTTLDEDGFEPDVAMTREEIIDIKDEEEELLEEHAVLGIYKKFGLDSVQFMNLDPSSIQRYIRIAKKIIMSESAKLEDINDELEETLGEKK